jgi:hypothetical protein
VKLPLKVVPGASREGLQWLGDDRGTLKVRVTAAPEKGKANKAVEKLIARRLDLPLSAVTITGGASSPNKIVEISGLSEAKIRAKL